MTSLNKSRREFLKVLLRSTVTIVLPACTKLLETNTSPTVPPTLPLTAEETSANTAAITSSPSPEPSITPTPTPVATETPTPNPIESVGADFWSALYLFKGGEWSDYVQTDRTPTGLFFTYAVDGTSVSNIPIPGVEGAVADMAVRAYYYDAKGDKQTILVAMVIKLPDGSLVRTIDVTVTETPDSMAQKIKNYPGSFQIGTPGSTPGAEIIPDAAYVTARVGGAKSNTPGSKAYLQFIQTNQTALQEFMKTGSPTLKILIPYGLVGSGGQNIFGSNPNDPSKQHP
jgi:hypothetical protein